MTMAVEEWGMLVRADTFCKDEEGGFYLQNERVSESEWM